MHRGLVVGLPAQAGLCPHRQGSAHAVRQQHGEISRFGRGNRDKGEKCRKRAENATPGCHGCNLPLNPAPPQEKEKAFSSEPGALPWGCRGLQRTWGDGRCCEALLLAGTSYGSAPSHRCSGAPTCLYLDPFCCQGMSAPKAGTPPLHPPPLSFWSSHHEMGAVGRDLRRLAWDSGHQPLPCLPIHFWSKMRLYPSADSG